MSTIRPLSISKVVYQDTEASDCLSKIHGYSSTNLLRRHPHNGRFSEASCRAHTEIVVRVLESLGFVTKKKKSVLKPTQTILFLGFIVNSIKMLLLLPEEKLQKLRSSALSLLKNVPTAREVLSFLGQCQTVLPALQMAPIHFRAIQRDLIQVISCQGDKVNYKKTISLLEDAIKNLLWWTQDPAQANGRVIIPPKVDSVIFSDASKIRWGAHLLQISIGGR